MGKRGQSARGQRGLEAGARGRSRVRTLGFTRVPWEGCRRGGERCLHKCPVAVGAAAHVPAEVALAPAPVAVSMGRRSWRVAAGSSVGSVCVAGRRGLALPPLRSCLVCGPERVGTWEGGWGSHEAISVVQAPGACRLSS